MEDRYAQNVSNNALVHLQNSEEKLFLQNISGSKDLVTTKSDPFSKKYMLQTINPTEFGTREELIRDVKWIARYNLSQAIQLQLDQEYEKENKNIKSWYVEQVNKYMPKLLAKLVSLDGSCLKVSKDQHPNEFGTQNARERTYVNRKVHNGTFHPFSYYYGFDKVVVSEYDDQNRYIGWGDEKRATLFFMIKIQNALDIPNVTGVMLKDLPVFLRHYKMKGYNGNSILNRLDPVDERIQNPWDKLNLNVMIPITKRLFHKMRKEQGLPKVTNFNDEFPTE